MKILYFSPRECWPATTGARLRDFHLARQLRVEHDLLYLGFTTEPDRPPVWRGRLQALDTPAILVRRGAGYAPLQLAQGILGPLPISVLNYSDATMRETLQNLLAEQRFDAVQMEGIHLYSYLPLLQAARPKLRIVSDWHNIESEPMRRFAATTTSLPRKLYAQRTAQLLESVERRMLSRCDGHLVCSERERQILNAIAPEARIRVVGNGVSLEDHGSEPIGEAANRHNLLFVGSMDYHANIDAAVYFAQQIWPAVSRLDERLRLVIAGSRPTPQVVALGQQPRITVTGTVPEMKPYYREALALVMPLRVGGGTRLKALEAMAQAVPVVSTTLGVEGITGIRDNENTLIADTPEATVEAIGRLRRDASLWKTLAHAGRQLVAEQYDWKVLGVALRDFHRQFAR